VERIFVRPLAAAFASPLATELNSLCLELRGHDAAEDVIMPPSIISAHSFNLAVWVSSRDMTAYVCGLAGGGGGDQTFLNNAMKTAP
jgi:hypothetical protein